MINVLLLLFLEWYEIFMSYVLQGVAEFSYLSCLRIHVNRFAKQAL